MEADKKEVYQQGPLIVNFNSFVDQANKYCGVNKIAPLKETGCCFSLVQYHIKLSHEGKREAFFLLLGYVINHFTYDKIAQHLADAEFREVEVLTQDNVPIRVIDYNDFLIEMPYDERQFRFSELFEFIQNISRGQSGYLRNKSTGRFAESVALRSLGRLESISGIWEDCYPMLCSKKNCAVFLNTIHLELHRFAIISSGNHAIGFERIGESQYQIYDPNNRDRPRLLSNLDQVGQSILEAFKTVGCIIDLNRGVVALSVQTVSFGLSYDYLNTLISSFRSKILQSLPWNDLSRVCSPIILARGVTSDYLLVIASKIYAVYLNRKTMDVNLTVERFIDLLPDAQKAVVRECINLMRRAAFPQNIEKHTIIDCDRNQLSAQQTQFITTTNAHLLQYQEGHLSRCDLASNVVRLISRQEQDEGLPKSESLEILRNSLLRYLDGAITSDAVLRSMPSLDLNRRDHAGFCLAHIALLESPNLVTLQALINRPPGLVKEFGSVITDRASVGVVLEQACPDVVEFLIEKIDIRSLITDTEILRRPIETGNVAVVAVLLKHQPEIVSAWSTRARNWGGRVNALYFAIRFDSISLAMLLIERECPLLEQEAKALLSRTPEWSEVASGPWDAVVRHIIGSDKLANKKALFDQALLIRNVNMAFLILATLDPDSSDFTEGQVRALLCAAETGDIEIIRQIIENNRKLVNSVDLDGQSVLSKACERGYREIVQYLIRKGADVEGDTSSPLTFAARAGDEKICEALLAKGATIFDRAQVRGKNLLVGQTPLAGVMLSNLETPQKKNLCVLLLSNCEDMLSAPIVTLAYEAIVTASQSELTTELDIKMIVELFRIDWSGNIKKDGMNLAMLSLESNNIPLVKFFLKSAHIDSCESHSEKGTLLCILIEKIREQEQKKANASHNFDDRMLQSLIDLAIEMINKFPQLIDIQRPSDGNSPLMLATTLINTIVVDELINRAARLHFINKRGWSVLHCAVTTMNRGIIELCLEQNSDLCRIKDCDGRLPMHYLAREATNFDQILELCGDQPLNIADNEGRNILHFAIRNPGNGDLVRTLLQRGFDPIKLVPEVVALEEIQESALTIAVNCLNYRGIVAILEHLPPLEMAVFSTLQELLKPHTHKIIACIKAEAGQILVKARTQDEGKSIALERLNRILENGIRLLSLSPEELAELQVVQQSLQPLERVKEGPSTQRGYK